jgi:hypothetical protein
MLPQALYGLPYRLGPVTVLGCEAGSLVQGNRGAVGWMKGIGDLSLADKSWRISEICSRVC